MIWRTYAVYDQAAAVFTHPFCCRTEPEAIRAFKESVTGGNQQMTKWKAQFALMYIGAYDDSSGGGSFLGTGPELVIGGLEAAAPEAPPGA